MVTSQKILLGCLVYNMWTFIGGLIGAIGTIIGYIVVAIVLILCLWSLIFDRDSGSIDGSGNDDGGGYGGNGGIF